MNLETKIDRSVYYLIKNLFSTVSYITVVDGYPETDIVLPTIAVDGDTINPIPFELGNRNRKRIRTWYVEIFAKTKSQGKEIAYTILDELEKPIIVYNYDEGFPPDVSPSQLGCLIVQYTKMEVIDLNPSLVNTLYYRVLINFEADYNTI